MELPKNYYGFIVIAVSLYTIYVVMNSNMNKNHKTLKLPKKGIF